jgi:hypothetical protein
MVVGDQMGIEKHRSDRFHGGKGDDFSGIQRR